jgi:hypothetical protein
LVAIQSNVAGLTIKGTSAIDTINVTTTRSTATAAQYSSDVVDISQGGNDTVGVTGATASLTGTANSFGFTTITGATGGDAIVFNNLLNAATFASAAVNVSAATTVLDAINLSINSTAAGAVVNTINWFTLGGNTYITQNVDGTSNLDATDIVVVLTGNVNLATSGVVAGLFTIA